MGVWIFRGVRVLLALGAIALAIGVVAYMSTEGRSLSLSDGPAWKTWLGFARIASLYLLPLSLFAFALWPRGWLVAMLPAVFLVVSEAVLSPDALTQTIQRITG